MVIKENFLLEKIKETHPLFIDKDISELILRKNKVIGFKLKEPHTLLLDKSHVLCLIENYNEDIAYIFVGCDLSEMIEYFTFHGIDVTYIGDECDLY